MFTIQHIRSGHYLTKESTFDPDFMRGMWIDDIDEAVKFVQTQLRYSYNYRVVAVTGLGVKLYN